MRIVVTTEVSASVAKGGVRQLHLLFSEYRRELQIRLIFKIILYVFLPFLIY